MSQYPDATEDDYPTDETLAKIAAWPHTDLAGALDFVKAVWHWPDFARHWLTAHESYVVHSEPGEKYLRLATGGWSGNESIVAAMKDNVHLRLFCWQLSARGGLSIWKYPTCAGEEGMTE